PRLPDRQAPPAPPDPRPAGPRRRQDPGRADHPAPL
ncbi:MAG: hypothetical protein AVDCRST_MAG48-698, partial [uncultured Friedmanniella sp.]